jgi:PPK2 family polyphosphate:nucleotide phosphotransferase
MAKHSDRRRWRVKPGTAVDLSRVDPSSTPGAPGSKDKTLALTRALDERLGVLQERLWAERRQSLLIVLQAIDAGGKDGTIKHVLDGCNPQGTKVASFKAPSEEELAHDFLWRVHKVTPAKGEIAVFNRSHYEDVIAVRVHELVPRSVWRARYRHINMFERNLHDGGTRIVKLFLHISRDEQARRFRERIDDPTKQWKFRAGDLEDRKRWDDYQTAFAAALERTSRSWAPWYVIPADHNWYRNWAVSRVLIETLERMDPRYPAPAEDLSRFVVD